jgi:3-phenylpropionate/trans-cinnamate dioxygenase ferredoxin reductase subunit
MSRRYVILGNGIAGQTCAEDLRALDPESSIVIVAAERHPLYNRVALPRYLRGQVQKEQVMMRTFEDYGRNGIEVRFETRATEVDVRERVVRTSRGEELGYDALLIATGGRPKPAPWPGAEEIDRAYQFQTLEDAGSIIEHSDRSARVLVMGGSFIGYELAEGIAHRGAAKVTWMMRGPWFLRDVLDAEAGRLCRFLGEEASVQIIVEDEVRRFARSGGSYVAETAGGRRIQLDMLTYGVGLDRNLEQFVGSGIGVRRGVVTDSKLRTGAPDVYAAGDVAVFYDLMLGQFNEMGSWDSAKALGRTAARIMTGAGEDFSDVPTYTTTMFGSTLAVMGVTPDRRRDLESVRAFSHEERFYRKLFFLGDRLVGAIIIGPPKGRKKLIELMRAREPVERPRESLLDPAALGA